MLSRLAFHVHRLDGKGEKKNNNKKNKQKEKEMARPWVGLNHQPFG